MCERIANNENIGNPRVHPRGVAESVFIALVDNGCAKVVTLNREGVRQAGQGEDFTYRTRTRGGAQADKSIFAFSPQIQRDFQRASIIDRNAVRSSGLPSRQLACSEVEPIMSLIAKEKQ